MSKITLMITLAWCTFACPAASAQPTWERSEWARYFAEKHVKGVFVLWDAKSDKLLVSDKERASRRLTPASTFKIANALIALDTGVVKDEHQQFPWDGVTRPIEAWNRSHTLASAMRHSVVPVYQSIARAIGPERMQQHLRSFDYGNNDISGGIDRFWLDGGLRISAVEQIELLRKLYYNRLPVSERSQRIVKDLILHEAAPDYRLRAKTGYEPPVGWWVGWVEREEGLWIFALNLDVDSAALLPERIAIAKAILRDEKVLPAAQ